MIDKVWWLLDFPCNERFERKATMVFKQISFCINRNEDEKFKIMWHYIKKYVGQLKDYKSVSRLLTNSFSNLEDFRLLFWDKFGIHNLVDDASWWLKQDFI